MRRTDRERPAEFAWQVVDKCPYAVLAMTDSEGLPYAVPLSIARSDNVVYFHAAKEGTKTDNLRKNSAVCLVCVGDVAPLPQEYSTEYESAILRGSAAEVTDETEKLLALRLIAERYAAENIAAFEQMVRGSLNRTAVWRIDVTEITGKSKSYSLPSQQ